MRQISANELRLELACALYARGRISAVGGARLAETGLVSFQGALMQRGIPRNYTIDDLHGDVAALRELFPQ